MPDARRYDPFGGLLAISLSVLTAAAALFFAVSLVRSVWPWLAGGAALLVLAFALTRLALWVQRRRSW